jgi:hypothetical protein
MAMMFVDVSKRHQHAGDEQLRRDGLMDESDRDDRGRFWR